LYGGFSQTHRVSHASGYLGLYHGSCMGRPRTEIDAMRLFFRCLAVPHQSDPKSTSTENQRTRLVPMKYFHYSTIAHGVEEFSAQSDEASKDVEFFHLEDERSIDASYVITHGDYYAHRYFYRPILASLPTYTFYLDELSILSQDLLELVKVIKLLEARFGSNPSIMGVNWEASPDDICREFGSTERISWDIFESTMVSKLVSYDSFYRYILI
jgi:hypothetical protein